MWNRGINEVFGDIMVLASLPRPPPRSPVDPDDMNTQTYSRNIQPISVKLYMWVEVLCY